jgi:uncharacterized membrane protein
MQFEDNELDRMRNDPENYKWGIFYFINMDPGTILPKRNKLLGWTVNFASPYSWLILVGIIVFAILMDTWFSK